MLNFKNNQIRQSWGFTIIESLLFLAISSSMLLLGLTFFKAASKNHFALAMRDLDSLFQDIINDVSVGYYATNKYDCTSTGVKPPNFKPSAGVKEQGTNSDCILLGKVVLLAPAVSSADCSAPSITQSAGDNLTEGLESIWVIPVAGNRLDSNGKETSSVSPYGSPSAMPTTVWELVPPVDSTNRISTRYGVELATAYIKLPSGTRWGETFPPLPAPQIALTNPNLVNAFGFYGSQSGGNIVSSSTGAQKVFTQPHGIHSSVDCAKLKRCIESNSPGNDVSWAHCWDLGEHDPPTPSTVTTNSDWVMCYWNSKHDKIASITISGSGSVDGILKTKLEMDAPIYKDATNKVVKCD